MNDFQIKETVEENVGFAKIEGPKEKQKEIQDRSKETRKEDQNYRN